MRISVATAVTSTQIYLAISCASFLTFLFNARFNHDLLANFIGVALISLIPWGMAMWTRDRPIVISAGATGLTALLNPMIIRHPQAVLLNACCIAALVAAILWIADEVTTLKDRNLYAPFDRRNEDEAPSEQMFSRSELIVAVVVLPLIGAFSDPYGFFLFLYIVIGLPLIAIIAVIAGAASLFKKRTDR